MRKWDYRVMVLQGDLADEIIYTIHEVYYDVNDIPINYSERPSYVLGVDKKNLEWHLDKMREALSKPVIWRGDKFPNTYGYS